MNKYTIWHLRVLAYITFILAAGTVLMHDQLIAFWASAFAAATLFCLTFTDID